MKTPEDWEGLLADAFAVIERTGDTVQWVTLRPDVYAEVDDLFDSTIADGETLWGAVVTMVDGQMEPVLLDGAMPPEATEQKQWLTDAYTQLAKRGATVTRIQIEAVGEGGTFTLTGEWSVPE